MVILVKVNQTYKPGTDPKASACMPWGCAKMLDNPNFRSRFRFLGVSYNKKIIAAYCITGLAQIIPSNPRKVWFELKNMNGDCGRELISVLQALTDSGFPKIKNSMSFAYLEKHDSELLEELELEENCCPNNANAIALFNPINAQELEETLTL